MSRTAGKKYEVERALPSNIEAEKLVLGAILLEGIAPFSVARSIGITLDDFLLEKHKRIYRAMEELADRGESIDRVTVANELMSLGQLESVDGMSYLVSLDDGLPQIYNFESYCRIIKEKALKRRIYLTSLKIGESALLDNDDADEIIQQATANILALASEGPKAGPVTVSQLIAQIQETPRGWERLTIGGAATDGLKTGLVKFDQLTGGLHKGEVTIIAGRPGMGKSALVTTIARNICRGNSAPVIFTLEMSKESILGRLVVAVARVDNQKYRLGLLNQEERLRTLRAIDEINSNWKLVLDSDAYTIEEMAARIERIKAVQPVHSVWIDYLQLMGGSKGKNPENRSIEIGQNTRAIKLLAKTLKVPFVVLSQLNRQTETRTDDGIPKLADLRESGSIEQDADNVVFVHRPEYYKPDREDLRGLADLIVAKQRNGPVDKARCVFLKSMMLFENFADDDIDFQQPLDIPADVRNPAGSE